MSSKFSLFLSRLGWRKDPNQAKAEETYFGLRQLALTIEASKLNLSPGAMNRVWGVLMEFVVTGKTVSLVSLADGTVSLYFSNGGGTIGLGQYKGPRQASEELIEHANSFLEQASPVKSFPLPTKGECIFYFKALDDVYKLAGNEKRLLENKLPLSTLFNLAHKLIAQINVLEEAIKALIPVASTGDIKNLKKILELGVNIDTPDKTGLTALMAAAYDGQADALGFLLKSHATIDSKDESGYSALMFAANSGQAACAEMLIQEKADVNAKAKDGSTPIMFAAQHGFNDVVRLLLKNGADPNVKGDHGLSAIGFAKQNRHKETEQILFSE